MAPKSKAEKKYLRIIPRFNKKIIMADKNSPIEGFEYFESEEYKNKVGKNASVVKNMFFSNGVSHFFKLINIFIKYMKPMMKGRNECFSDLDEYFYELSEHHLIEKQAI